MKKNTDTDPQFHQHKAQYSSINLIFVSAEERPFENIQIPSPLTSEPSLIWVETLPGSETWFVKHWIVSEMKNEAPDEN